MPSVLIAVKGNEDESWYGRVARLLPAGADITLAHVIDIEPRTEIELTRGRYLGRRPLGAERGADMERAEREASEASLGFARAGLEGAGVPGDRIREIVLRGKAKEALRERAELDRFDLIVVAGRGGKPGPHSLGKTARFLVDHTATAALLIR